MHLIFCVDDKDGILFCGRRLSRDSKVTEHILSMTSGAALWMSLYSGKLFPKDKVFADADFQKKAQAGDYCFLEELPLPETCENRESVTLYHWNRSYPATVRFPRMMLENMHLVSTEEFPGSSHEKIIVERYTL